MSKKILISLSIVSMAGAIGIGGTVAYFSDTETSTGNTFTTGTLDLKVNGEDAFIPFEISNMKPGDTLGTATYTIKNNGSLPGVLSYKVTNVTTNENGVIDPEESAGDAENLRLDPDGYSIAASGYGEFLDQVYIVFWVDDTSGQRPASYDWEDCKFWAGYPNESDYYSLPTDTDLMAEENIVLNPGEELYMGITVMFISETWPSYSWILDGIPNNTAMGDDFQFDIELGLNQITP